MSELERYGREIPSNIPGSQRRYAVSDEVPELH
jgi:hypothetical protein